MTDETSHEAPPMYCPACDEVVPEEWDRYDETFFCPICKSHVYESKEEYIDILHATARWQREHGYGPWWDGDEEDEELVTDGGQSLILYLIRAQCPNCDEITGFVEERVRPIALDTDVHLSAEFCPNCSFFVAGEASWDVHEETEIERVLPTQERGMDA